MGKSERPADSIRTFAQHAELAYSVAGGAPPTPDIEQLSTSWRQAAKVRGDRTCSSCPMPDVDPAFLSVTDCAKYFGVSRPTIYKLIQQGDIIQAKRFGNRSLVDMSRRGPTSTILPNVLDARTDARAVLRGP